MKNMKSILWLIIPLIIGTSVGSGAIWQWQRLKLEKSNSEIAEIYNIAELRKSIGDINYEIIELIQKYVQTKELYDSNKSTEVFEILQRLKIQMKIKEDDFTVLENKLANLENRDPRSIKIDLPVPSRAC